MFHVSDVSCIMFHVGLSDVSCIRCVMYQMYRLYTCILCYVSCTYQNKHLFIVMAQSSAFCYVFVEEHTPVIITQY